MRKVSTLFCSAATIALAVGLANAELIPVKDFLSKQTKHEIPAGFTRMNPDGQVFKSTKSGVQSSKVLSQSQTTTVLFEDFNNVPDGEFVQTGNIGMRAVTPIANYDCGKYMNPEYTPNSGQWYGEWVYAGTGGTVICQAYNPQAGAMLQLPLGDYSGDLILTMRVRTRPAFWGSDTESGYSTSASGGCDINYYPAIGGYGSYAYADSEVGESAYLAKLYPNDGWAEVKATFRNKSADSDGSIIIYLPDACEIDWIKVEDAGTYLAAPVSEGVTDFQEDQFTVKWGEVRRAFNYYVDFFYAKWLADKGVDDKFEFEEGIPADFTAGGSAAAAGEGFEDTEGVRLADGEDAALVTPTFVSLLNEGSVKFKLKQTMSDDDLYDLDEYPTFCIDGLTDEGWTSVTKVQIDGDWNPGNVFLNGKMSGGRFANLYKALRFYSKNTDDENYIVMDDLVLYAPRPYELERVVDPDYEHGHDQQSFESYLPYIEEGWITEEDAWDAINSPFNTWWNTEVGDPCEYTFKDCVESDKEYYYRIRSHRMEINGNGNTFTGEKIHHAFGVAAPKLGDATDVTTGSYTATWKDAAKAQNFMVRNYEAIEVSEDTPDYEIFNETFANIDGPSSFDVYEPVTDDVVTDMPGWSGEKVTMGANSLGCSYGGILVSPEIGVVTKGNKKYYVYFEAEGYDGESLIIQFNGLESYVEAPFGEDGHYSGVITVDTPVEGETISFYTYDGTPFGLLSLEVTQDVEKGSVVRKFNDVQVVPAGVEKAEFSGLDAEAKYAYSVVSLYKLEKKTVRSMPDSLYKVVDLKSGKSSDYSKVGSLDENVEVVARYTVEGFEAGEDYKGLVIEKLSNGKTRKVIVR